jgi:hypothetical protein
MLDDRVLCLQQIGDGLVEAIRPQVIAALRVDELDVDPRRHPFM